MKRYLFILFMCFAGVINVQGQSLDLRLLENINGPPGGADDHWRNVSNSIFVTITVTPVAMLVTGLATHNKELEIKALETGASIVIAEGLTGGLKAIIQRKRPYEAYPDLVYAKISTADYSFPSGHTSTAFALATSLSLSFPKWYVIAPSFTYAGAVGYSRMYLGVHYPSDILAGAVVGIGSSFLTWKLQKLLNKKYHYH